MILSKLLDGLDIIESNVDMNLNVSKITSDSNLVDNDTLFVAIKGFTFDAHSILNQVVEKKALAIVCEKYDENLNTNYILVNNSRKALARISSNYYNNPSKKTTLIGITGTKGKTSTSFIIKNVLEEAEKKVALLGTISNMIGNEAEQSKLTTPESTFINNFLDKAINKNCNTVVMEVSSHALELNRVDYLDFDFAVFTNLDSDHMDFHKTHENYLLAKKKLFDNLKESAYSIINIDCKYSAEMIKDTKSTIVTFGTNINADYKIENIKNTLAGTSFTIQNNGEKFHIESPLVGSFNVLNTTAAFIVGVMNGLYVDKVIEGIKKVNQIPGRFELIKKEKKKVVIDYAHTTESLRQVLILLNQVKEENTIITIFGCGGNRDKLKRPAMGLIASELSDLVVVTTDNPRDEKPEDIIKDITKGILSKNYIVEVDRRIAIIKTIETAPDDSIILIAGKGHENYQEIAGERFYFSDKELALECLK